MAEVRDAECGAYRDDPEYPAVEQRRSANVACARLGAAAQAPREAFSGARMRKVLRSRRRRRQVSESRGVDRAMRRAFPRSVLVAARSGVAHAFPAYRG